jgi:hypothetical protein
VIQYYCTQFNFFPSAFFFAQNEKLCIIPILNYIYLENLLSGASSQPAVTLMLFTTQPTVQLKHSKLRHEYPANGGGKCLSMSSQLCSAQDDSRFSSI